MRKMLKSIPGLKLAVNGFRKITGISPAHMFINKAKKRQIMDIHDYFIYNSSAKLHIGCQSHPMEGWLNVDLVPKLEGVVYMNAAKKFPFQDNMFDYVFAEHMIEHIPLDKGQFMLQECYRVLNPGGVLRVVTPNLQSLVNYYIQPDLPLHADYTTFSKRYFIQPPPVFNATVVLNNFFRDWGHQFIYDADTLIRLFVNAGFQDPYRQEVARSAYGPLCHLEKHQLEITPRFNEFESLVIEAVKK